MPRRIRDYLPGVPQHVIQRGNNRQIVFFEQAHYEFYLFCLKDAATTYGCDIHAYTLLPNHVHLLATPHEPDSIPKTVQSIGRRYVQYINSTCKRSGTLWEGRYRSCLVEPGDRLLDCYRYIELDAVRSGLVSDAKDYTWSSYRYHTLGENNAIITSHARYEILGSDAAERRAAYRRLCEQNMDDELLQEILRSTENGRALGTDCFKDCVEELLSRPVRAGKPGRPRKKPGSPTG